VVTWSRNVLSAREHVCPRADAGQDPNFEREHKEHYFVIKFLPLFVSISEKLPLEFDDEKLFVLLLNIRMLSCVGTWVEFQS
jgi:hypothetical protein